MLSNEVLAPLMTGCAPIAKGSDVLYIDQQLAVFQVLSPT